jgi:hypothetical protein
MLTFGQQNYPKLYLGKTRYTFARYGCLSDVIVMEYDFLFGKNKTPNQIVPQLQYNSDGMLIWSSLKNIGLELKQRYSGGNPRPIIDKWWSNQNVGCALEIRNGAHFVWQIGRYWPGLGYRIFDPWTNTKTWQKYNITGCRIFGKI